MTAALAHRGPDDDGLWTDPAAGVGLGHRRLAILDPSPAGRQPMVSASGRLVLTYNGEIYNFRELRRELEGRGARFRGSGDSEVLLAALERFGVEGALARIAGMFAFALWDRRQRRLTLARDHLGIKPLYWTREGHELAFASELGGLLARPHWSPAIDRDALAAYAALEPRAGALRDLRGRAQAAPRPPADPRCRWPARGAPLLAPARAAARRRPRGGAARGAAGDARPRGAPADAGRRAARRAALGRGRFQHGRRADAGGGRRAGAHLHDRLRGAGLRRGAVRARGRRGTSAPCTTSCALAPPTPAR